MKYRSTANEFNRFFSMKQYTIVWMFETYCVKRFDVVSTMSNFKKRLIQHVNKIKRKCSVDNEKIYRWLQVALVYASFACRIYRVTDSEVVAWSPPISGTRTDRVKIRNSEQFFNETQGTIFESKGGREAACLVASTIREIRDNEVTYN